MKKMKKRTLGIIILTIIIAFGMGACGNNSAAGSQDAAQTSSSAATGEAVSESGAFPGTVNIGYFSYVDETVLVKQERFFDEYLEANGSSANWLQFEAGRDINNAILADSLDIAGGIGDPPIAIAAESGVDYKIVYIECETGTAEGLAVRESAGIGAIGELKGKTIATVVTSTSHYSLLAALEANGLTANDVEILDLTAPDSVAAWERGDIDAVYTWEPHLSVIAASGGKLLINSEEVAKLGSPVSNYVIVRTKFAEQYPEIVTEFVRSLIKADELYKSEPDKAAASWAEFLSITPEDALNQAKGSSWLTVDEILSAERLGTSGSPGNSAAALKKVGDFLVDQQSLTAKQDVSTYEAYLDPQYLEAAAK